MARTRKPTVRRFIKTAIAPVGLMGALYAVIEPKAGWFGLYFGKTLDGFLPHVSPGRFKAAYAMTAPQYRERWPIEAFRKEMVRIGLTGYGRNRTRQRISVGSVHGASATITTGNGSEFLLNAVTIGSKEDARIHSVRRAYDTQRKRIDADERPRMVRDTPWDFRNGFRGGNFSHIIVTATKFLRRPRRIGPSNALETPFGLLVKARFDLLPYLSHPVAFGAYACPGAPDRPRTEVKSTVVGFAEGKRAMRSALGTLSLKGHISGTPCLAFDLEFDRENRAWRMARVKLLLVPYTSGAARPAR